MRRPAKPARPTADQDLSRAVGFMTIPFRNGEYQGEFKIGRRVGKGRARFMLCNAGTRPRAPRFNFVQGLWSCGCLCLESDL